MKNTIIAREITIDASKEKVWWVLANFGDIYKASRGVKKSYLTSEQKTGVWTTRHCDLMVMWAEVEERIIDWKEGQSMKIDIYKRKNLPMIHSLIGDFDIREENGKTILRGVMTYSMTGFIGNLMNILMMKRMNTKNWNAVLAGFKKHIETGEELTPNSKIDINLVRKA